MIENGMRLQVTVDENSIVVIDTVTEKSLIYKNGLFIKDDLNHEDVVHNLIGIQSNILAASVTRKLFTRTPVYTIGVSISELAHCQCILRARDTEGYLDNGIMQTTRSFKSQDILNAIAKVIDVLSRAGNTVLRPNTDKCRLISDIDLFVIRDSKHCICVKDMNRNGNILINCLYDNEVFNWLYVDIHVDENKVYIFNCELNYVTSFDLDDSFYVYFVEDKNLFEEEKTNE